MSYYDNETIPKKQSEEPKGDTVAFGGRLTRDPELNTTQNGSFVTNLSIAFDNSKVEGGTTFASVTVWGTKARLACDFLSKGMPISGTGKRYYKEYTKKDGTPAKELTYKCNTLLFDIEEIVNLVGKMMDKRLSSIVDAAKEQPKKEQPKTENPSKKEEFKDLDGYGIDDLPF